MKSDDEQPEMDLAQGFVEHPSSNFRVPVIKCTEERKENSADNHVMKMRDDEIRAAKLPIERRCAQHDAGETSNQKLKEKSDTEQHGDLELNPPSPHRANPVEYFNPRRDADGERGDREKTVGVGVHPDREHVVCPNAEAYEADADGRCDHYWVSENRFPGKYRDNLR